MSSSISPQQPSQEPTQPTSGSSPTSPTTNSQQTQNQQAETLSVVQWCTQASAAAGATVPSSGLPIIHYQSPAQNPSTPPPNPRQTAIEYIQEHLNQTEAVQRLQIQEQYLGNLPNDQIDDILTQINETQPNTPPFPLLSQLDQSSY